MKIVMTMMVRDEVDIVSAVLEHHLAQGVDFVIVTDNGSVDGTAELLQRYADLDLIELHHDPRHRKQQSEVVTAMARRASTEYGADWVINGDADEFVIARDPNLTVRQALERTPTTVQSFTVPVVNLIGPPSNRGSGIDRLVWRDLRSNKELRRVGIPAQPTANTIHVGDPTVTVAQGNHFTSIQSLAMPPAAAALEVLHLPWRSWGQIEQKVLHAGRGYDANPDLRPSRNHHGMKDYRRAQNGYLREIFSARMPQASELASSDRFVPERALSHYLRELLPQAKFPEALQQCLSTDDDEPWSFTEHQALAQQGALYLAKERRFERRPPQLLRRAAGPTRKIARAFRGSLRKKF